jgi:hypothetical protein
MAVGIIQRFPEGVTAADYDPVAEKLDPQSNPPEGCIFHCAYELDGVFQAFDVWETREQFDRFVEQRLIPAQKEVMGEEAVEQMASAGADAEGEMVAGMGIVETEIHNYFAA